MITFFEFKNDIKNDDLIVINEAIEKNGFAVVKLITDDNKVQIKQFDKIKKNIKYKPDSNIKFYWNNSNNFTIIDSDKIKIFEI